MTSPSAQWGGAPVVSSPAESEPSHVLTAEPISWWKRLSVKFSVLIAVVILVVLAIFVLVAVRVQRDHLTHEVVRSAALLVPVLLVLGAAHGYCVLRRRMLGLAGANGVRFTPRAYYAPGHTWAQRIGRESVRVGLDDLAQRLFIGLRAIDLPKSGTVVRAGESVGTISCGDKRAEITSPVSGTVTAVNDALIAEPALVNRAPYERGWLFTVAPSDSAFERLRHGKRARAWLAAEGARLAWFLEQDLGVAAADGGETIAPTRALLSQEQWTALTRNFLLTA